MGVIKRGRTAGLLALLGALALAALLAIACGGGDDEAEPTATSEPAATVEEPTEAAPPTTAPESTAPAGGDIAFDAA